MSDFLKCVKNSRELVGLSGANVHLSVRYSAGGTLRVKIWRVIRASLSLAFIAWFSSALNAQTLGTPGNITDSFDAANQVGRCINQYGANSCTANDFRITTIDIQKVDDGCVGPDDYMQVDALVSFSKATPTRYDIMAWFYRGDDTSAPPTPNFIAETAVNGYWCNRIGLASGLAITGSVLTSGVEETKPAEIDGCFDVPNTSPGDLQQTINNIVLPCRDIGVPDPADPSGPLLSSTADGTADISACTSWDNNSNSFCSGPQYDGVTEPNVGTPSKCNCGEFSGITTTVGIPDVIVTKVCDPTSLRPGETTACTITITNNGTGAQEGATAFGDAGFFYEDDYPESQGAVSNITTTQGLAVDDYSTNSSGLSTEGTASENQTINIYPGDILGGSTVTIEYDFTTSLSLPNTLTNISNTVCGSYFDGASQVFDYEGVDGDLCATEIVTTPVTLGGFSVQQSALGGYDFEWVTETESNNIGFNLYGVLGKTLHKLNDEIIPSQSVSTMEQSYYSTWLDIEPGLVTKRFYLEDIDIEGNTKKHGPFQLSSARLKVVPQKTTNWKSIKTSNAQTRKLKQNKKLQARRSMAVNTAGSGAVNAMIYNIVVEKSGPQRIALTTLSGAGIDTSRMLQGRYQLTDLNGQQIASRVQRGRGGAEGFIEFIGVSERSFYSSNSVYQLRLTDRNNSALELEQARAFKGNSGSVSKSYQHTETVHGDSIYVNSSHVPGDPWMMNRLFAYGGTRSTSFVVPLSHVSADGGAATVVAQVVGGIDVPDQVDRATSLMVGGEQIAELGFDGTEAAELTGVASLEASQSSIDLTLSTTPLNSSRVDILYTNEISVTYPREYVAINNALTFSSLDTKFEVDGFSDQVVYVFAQGAEGSVYLGEYPVVNGRVEFMGLAGNHEYLAFGESAMSVPSVVAVASESLLDLGAEHLIIAHQDFVGEALESYSQQRQQFGAGSSAIVNTESIYTQYGGGVRSADAIHEFLKAYGRENDLLSVLIVGGDVYDYHDNLGIGAVSYVPTLYRATGRLIKFSPVDSLFGDLDGDDVPDVPVGRMPVRTVEELQILLGKSIRYANQRGERTAVLAADEKGSSATYDFKRASQGVAALLEPQGWQMTTAYLDDMSVASVRSTLMDSLSQGPRFALYTGHSAPGSWSGKNIFNYQNALSLNNVDRPSAYLQWGCYNTFFSSPTADSMSHGLMLAGDQGAAVVMGSSTLTSAYAEEQFAKLIQNELLDVDRGFGDAMVAAKAKFHLQTGLAYKGIMWGVSLLGDPLLKL